MENLNHDIALHSNYIKIIFIFSTQFLISYSYNGQVFTCVILILYSKTQTKIVPELR